MVDGIRLISMHVCERVDRLPDGSYQVINNMRAVGVEAFPIDFTAVVAVRFSGAGGPTRIRVDFVRVETGAVEMSRQAEVHVRASAAAHAQLFPTRFNDVSPARYSVRAYVNDAFIGEIDFAILWEGSKN